MSVAHNIQEKTRTCDVFTEENQNVDFSGLLLSDQVTKGLMDAGFQKPSPIQLKAIPLGRCGLDLIVQAKSGTGKTCVFTVIALESLQLESTAVQVLVLAPTREIATQIWEVITSIGRAMPELQCHTFIGGMPYPEDVQKLKLCHIAVGTPGRIKQLIENRILKIDSIRLFVLDEADKLLEESFQEQINWIYSTLPNNKQMLALSATYPEYLAKHLTMYMRNPTFLRLNVTDPALLGIKQYFKSVPYHPLPNKLFDEKIKVVTHLLSSVNFHQCLMFSNLQTRAENLADALVSQGWPTTCIAGSYEQKDRNEAMAKLKTYRCRVLISTDLTSRGIDADRINLVINLDVPKSHETYLHRVGRAGRFGTFGAAVTIVSQGQELQDLQALEKKCNTTIRALPDPVSTDLCQGTSPANLIDLVSTEKIISTPAPELLSFVEEKHNDKNMDAKSSCLQKEVCATEENITVDELSEAKTELSALSDGLKSIEISESVTRDGQSSIHSGRECCEDENPIPQQINVSEEQNELFVQTGKSDNSRNEPIQNIATSQNLKSRAEHLQEEENVYCSLPNKDNQNLQKPDIPKIKELEGRKLGKVPKENFGEVSPHVSEMDLTLPPFSDVIGYRELKSPKMHEAVLKDLQQFIEKGEVKENAIKIPESQKERQQDAKQISLILDNYHKNKVDRIAEINSNDTGGEVVGNTGARQPNGSTGKTTQNPDFKERSRGRGKRGRVGKRGKVYRREKTESDLVANKIVCMTIENLKNGSTRTGNSNIVQCSSTDSSEHFTTDLTESDNELSSSSLQEPKQKNLTKKLNSPKHKRDTYNPTYFPPEKYKQCQDFVKSQNENFLPNGYANPNEPEIIPVDSAEVFPYGHPDFRDEESDLNPYSYGDPNACHEDNPGEQQQNPFPYGNPDAFQRPPNYNHQYNSSNTSNQFNNYAVMPGPYSQPWNYGNTMVYGAGPSDNYQTGPFSMPMWNYPHMYQQQDVYSSWTGQHFSDQIKMLNKIRLKSQLQSQYIKMMLN